MNVTKMADGRWLLEMSEHVIPMTGAALTSLAELLAFRLEIVEVGTNAFGGIEARTYGDARLHIAYSDEAEELIRHLAADLGVVHGEI